MASPPAVCGVFELTVAPAKQLPLGALLGVGSGPTSPESMELNAPGSKRICCESSTQPSAGMVFWQSWALLHFSTRFQYVSVHRIDPQHAAIAMVTRNRLHGRGGKSQCRWLNMARQHNSTTTQVYSGSRGALTSGPTSRAACASSSTETRASELLAMFSPYTAPIRPSSGCGSTLPPPLTAVFRWIFSVSAKRSHKFINVVIVGSRLQASFKCRD